MGVSTNHDFKVISSCGGVPELCLKKQMPNKKQMPQGLDNKEEKEREDEQEEDSDKSEEISVKEHYEDMVDDALLGVMDDGDEEEG